MGWTFRGVIDGLAQITRNRVSVNGAEFYQNSTPTPEQQQNTELARSLSDLGLIYCGKAGFGQISRSFSLNSYGYSPQTIEKSASNRLSLPTIA
jgi:hypothetical protein